MVFAAEWQNHEDGAPLVSDYDQDSGPELIASFALLGSATEARLPFAIDWDDGRYRVISLMPKPPQLDERGLDSSTIAYRQEAYQTRISLYDTIPDPSGNRTLIGWRVQAFAVVQQPNPRVLTGYSMRTPVNGQTHLLELHASQIRSGDLALASCTPSSYACRAPKQVEEVEVPPGRVDDRGLRDAWNIVGSHWTASPVKVIERNR
jgi:hypothetical protein